MGQGSPPDYNVVVKRMDGVGVNNKIGVMWWDPEKNRGTIALDAGVSLKWDDQLYINVYPRDDAQGPPPGSGGGLSGGSRGHGGPPPSPPRRGSGYSDDDIPF